MCALGDWTTVDSTRVRSGIGRLLWAENRRFLAEIGASFSAGFINFGGLPGKGRAFWTAAAGDRGVVFEKPRQWARVLNGRRLAASLWSRLDQFSALAAGSADALFNSSTPLSVRDYRAGDAEACHALFTQHMLNFDLAYRWDKERLAHQLGYGEPGHTLVLEKGGSVAGFTSFQILDVFGRTTMRNGIIDVVAPKELAFKDELALLQSAVNFMRAREVDLALVFGPPMHAATTLSAAGFMPMPSTYKLLAIPAKTDVSLAGIKSVYAQLR
jgi:hypothetical protein